MVKIVKITKPSDNDGDEPMARPSPNFGNRGDGGAPGIGQSASRNAPTMRGVPKDDHDRLLDRALGKLER